MNHAKESGVKILTETNRGKLFLLCCESPLVDLHWLWQNFSHPSLEMPIEEAEELAAELLEEIRLGKPRNMTAPEDT